MLWVLKRTISMKHFLKLWQKIIYNYKLKELRALRSYFAPPPPPPMRPKINNAFHQILLNSLLVQKSSINFIFTIAMVTKMIAKIG